MEQWRKNLYTLVTTQICCMVGFGLVMPFIAFYFQEMGMKVGSRLDFMVSLANTLPAVGMAISSPIWGALSDRKGRKSMLIRACGCATIIMLLMGLVSSVGPFLVLRLLQGLFTGTITASMAFVSSNTPEEHMSSSLGLLSASNFIGYSIGPVIGGLLAEIIGYRSCFFLSAAMMLFATVIVIKVTVEDPSTYGVALVEQRKREKQRKKEESLKKGIAVRTFTPLVIGLFTVLFLQRMCRFVFTPFLALYVQQVRGTLEWASGITGIINGCICIATAVSSVTLVRIADRHDKIRLIFLYAVICLTRDLV